MKRLLLLGLAVAVSSCGLGLIQAGSSATAPDPLGATLTRDVGPKYDTLIFLPGKGLVRNTVVHLEGPKLRVNDDRCQIVKGGLACTFGTVLANERRVIYVSGLSRAHVTGQREDGSPVDVGVR